jgi:hypothetical protein
LEAYPSGVTNTELRTLAINAHQRRNRYSNDDLLLCGAVAIPWSIMISVVSVERASTLIFANRLFPIPAWFMALHCSLCSAGIGVGIAVGSMGALDLIELREKEYLEKLSRDLHSLPANQEVDPNHFEKITPLLLPAEKQHLMTIATPCQRGYLTRCFQS